MRSPGFGRPLVLACELGDVGLRKVGVDLLVEPGSPAPDGQLADVP